MSYARWGWDGSDVYVFASNAGGVTCCGCALLDWPDEAIFYSAAEVVEHMREHVAGGDNIPEYLLDEATYDREDFE